MSMQGKTVIRYGGVFLNTIIFATYYSLVKESLSHWGTLAFICCTIVLSALPAGVLMSLFTSRDWSVALFKWALLFGCLYTGISIALSQALAYTSVAETAFFPCLNGIVAAMLARFVFGRSTGKTTSPITWLMALLAACGMLLLMRSAPPSLDHWRGDAIAFLAGTVLYVVYVFLVEAFLREVGSRQKNIWAMLCMQFLVMSALAAGILLVFGDWQTIHPVFPGDFWPLGYLGVGDVVLSNVITLCVQSSLDATTITFLGILEPILADVGATVLLGEKGPWTGYLGAALGVLSVLGQTVLPPLLSWLVSFRQRQRTFHFPRVNDSRGNPSSSKALLPLWSPYLAWEQREFARISEVERTRNISAFLRKILPAEKAEMNWSGLRQLASHHFLKASPRLPLISLHRQRRRWLEANDT